MMSARTKVRIVLPVCIFLVVFGIWAAKNLRQRPAASIAPPESGSLDGPSLPAGEGDFELEAASIDLEGLKAHKLPIVIDFGSDSCIPCREMAPVLKKMNREMHGKAIIKFVDVWKNGQAAAEFPVQVIPTQIFINSDGTPYVPGKAVIDSGVEFSMYKKKGTGEHAFTVHQGGLSEEQIRSILADMGAQR